MVREPGAGSYDSNARWDTFAVTRRVLVLARTVTAVNRLLDVLLVVGGDPRVQVLFAADRGSQFHDGVVERVRGAGFRLIPWAQAHELDVDLVISASDKGDLARFRAPLLLVQHGVGYHRRTISPHGDGVSGLTFPLRPDDEPERPTTVAVAHHGQVADLRRVSPHAARHAVVAGDLCLDRLLISMPLRPGYRHAFDARQRKLVFLSSTWGGFSLLGSDPTLPARMVAELDIDRYRVAIAPHPNVWARHGNWQVRRWLANAVDAGLMLITPDEGWRAALIAADTVISDHGSVTCYAAALGKPILLAADGTDEVVPGSPMDALRTALPRLDRSGRFAAQVEHVLGAHDPDRVSALTTLIFAHRGQAAGRLRGATYRLLGLAPPEPSGPIDPIPVPDVVRHAPDALIVRTAINRPAHNHVVVTTVRTPAALHERWIVDPRPVHLVAYLAGGLPATESAAVLVADEPAASADVASQRASATLSRYPGARVAAVGTADRVVLRIRSGDEVHLAPRTTDVQPAAWASAVHACVVAGMNLNEIDRVTVRTGAGHSTADVTVIR